MPSPEIIERIQATLASIRPYLLNDGGDVVLESVSDDMVVCVRLLGACDACRYNHMTLNNGIREAIMRDVPEVKEVVAQNAGTNRG